MLDGLLPTLLTLDMSTKRYFLLLAITLLACSGCAKLKGLGSDARTDDWPVEKFYQEAKESREKKRYGNAIELYQKLEARYPYGPYAEQAQLDVAYAYYHDDQPEAAIAAADRFVRLHPTHPNVDYAYYLKGLVNFNEQQNVIDRMLTGEDLSNRDPRAARESFKAFRELVTRYPDSRYSADSHQRMAYLRNTLAMHDVHVADYYYRRGAFVAVVNRCKYIIEQYQQTPAVEDALGLMALAYRQMGMTNLAEDSLRVLELNFPRSAYLQSYAKARSKRRFSLVPRFLRRDKSDDDS